MSEDRKVPGVHLSWAEAVRVVPDLVATEAERITKELDDAKKLNESLAERIRLKENGTRDALCDLGEAIERFNREEHELARTYVQKAMNILQGKKRREGL